MAEPSHAQSRKPTAEVAAIQDCANKDQDNSAIGQGADKIATFLAKPFDVNQCLDGVGRDALRSKGVRQWKKAEEIGHDHVIETSGKMHSLRRTIKHTR